MEARIFSLFVSLAALATFCQAQSMPTCAANCFTIEVEQSSCNSTDYACICADETLMTNIETCVLGSCTVIEALTARNATATLCHEPVRYKTRSSPLATAITGSIAILFVAARSSDRFIRREFGWADVCALLAMISALPMDVLEFLMTANGFGRDIWTLTAGQITRVVKYTWLSQIFYVPAIGLTKISVLLFFLRVFPGDNFRRICLLTIAHCAAFTAAILFGTIFSCTPIEYTWLGWTGEVKGSSIDTNAFWWAQAGINIATDLFILLLPIPGILALNLGTRKKIYVLLMFSVGLFITIISIVRLTGLVSYSNTTNPTYNNVGAATWSVVECHTSIICCCMPAARTLMARLFPRLFGSAYAPGSDPNGGNPSDPQKHDTPISGRYQSVTVSSSKPASFELLEPGAHGRFRDDDRASSQTRDLVFYNRDEETTLNATPKWKSVKFDNGQNGGDVKELLGRLSQPSI
ncbi:hypothetical protein F5Y15DRAFT_417064 [Xylariaceae sp. FL0016]|nr:hypothetical protein F5Y15DRAFT_417064 [Xylariaceae sp. FL0016]